MIKFPNIEQLQYEILNDFSDIKAESIIAMAMENGFRVDEFQLASESIFNRPFKRDILSANLLTDNQRKEYILLNLSRNGLHDLLPEGLFYQNERSKFRENKAVQMAEDCKANKLKEVETRRFFMPFENALYSQRIQLESEEYKLLAGLQNGILNDYFTRFWGINPTIPKSLITALIELLPHAFRIVGNLTLTASCLELLLDEKVRIDTKSHQTNKVTNKLLKKMIDLRLGIDTLLGDSFEEEYICMEISIGPLKNSEIGDYLEGGEKNEFIQTYFNFFLPAESEIFTNIIIDEEKSYMTLNLESQSVLGFSSTLMDEV